MLITEELRPRSFSDFISGGQPEASLLDIGYSKETNSIPKLLNYVFYGSAGLGKTSLAMTIVKEMDLPYLYKNGSSDNGIDMIREEIVPFAAAASLDLKLKVVIIDEADRLSPQAQDAIKVVIENYHMTTRFIFIVNRPEKIIPPVWSRCVAVNFGTLDMKGYLMRVKRMCYNLKISYEGQTLIDYCKTHYPDTRAAANGLELCKDGVLVIKTISTVDSYIRDIVKSIFNADVKLQSISALIKSTNFAMRFDQVYEEVVSVLVELNNPAGLCIVAEHYHRDPTTPNRYVNLLAMVGGVRRTL